MFRYPRALRYGGPLALAAAGALLAQPAAAQPTPTVSRDLAQPVLASTVSSYGAPETLAGTRATVRYSDGSVEQAVFVAQGTGVTANAFAEVAGAFAIVASGGDDTSRPGTWSVSNLSTTRTLVGFTLEGLGAGEGRAGFDVSTFTTTADTTGSGTGVEMLMDFTGRTFITGSVTTTYSLPVALVGQAPAGDLFGRVDVALAYTTAGLGGGLPPITFAGAVFSTQRFGSDLDVVNYLAVPEPSAASLALAGLGVLLLRARRSRRSAAARAR